MADFQIAFAYLMKKEDDAKQPGKVTEPGPTRFGIDARFNPQAVKDGFYEMPYANALAYAFQFYLKTYWKPLRGSEIGEQLAANYLLSIAVNCGLSRLILWAQGAVGVSRDGVVGPKTLAAWNARPVRLLAKVRAAALLVYAADAPNVRDGLLARADG